MKKNVILFTILSLIMLFTACKKDTSLTNVNKHDSTEQKILNFKEKMQNPNKSDETISIDSAVWYIEAALNYTYCILEEEEVPFNDYILDSIVFNNFSNNNISFSVITDTYASAENTMNSSLALLETESKRFDIVDVEYEDGNLKILYNINYLNSNKNNKSGGCTELYDDWYWSWTLGKYPTHECSPDWGANNIIQYHIQESLNITYVGYYTDVKSAVFEYHEYPELYGSDLLWQKTISLGNAHFLWLSEDKMVEHKNGSLNAFHIILASKLPAGYKYVGGSAQLRPAVGDHWDPDFSRAQHYWRMRIGKVHNPHEDQTNNEL